VIPLWGGFRLGMLLQFAIGPVCVFVFNVASSSGFGAALAAVLAVAAVDALYIALASFGIAALLEKQGVRTTLKYFGAGVLLLFAAGAVLSTLVFLTAIAGLGSLTQRFLPIAWRNLLNVLVGCVLVFFAARMLLRSAGG